MTKYKCTISATTCYKVEVEAEDEEAAFTAAQKAFDTGLWDFASPETMENIEVVEIANKE